MLCVWDSNHTVVAKSSSAIISGCCKSIRTRSLHETKAKQIFFCTRLCGEKWPNGSSKAQQWTLRPLIRSMEGKYGAPTHAWTQKNQWKKSTKLAFWKTCHDEFTSCDYHSCFGLDGKGITWPLRLGLNVFQPSSVGLSNFLITCRSAQTEQRGYKGGMAAENELLWFSIFACH